MIVDLDAEDLDKKITPNISWIMLFFGAVFAELNLKKRDFVLEAKANNKCVTKQTKNKNPTKK